MSRPAINGLSIHHSVPGRLRIKIEALRERPEVTQPLREELLRIAHLKEVEIRSLTGSLILLYDPGQLTTDRLMEGIGKALRDSGMHPPEAIRPNLLDRRSAAPEPDPLFSILSPGSLWNLLALSGFLVYRAAHSLITGLVFAQNPTSLTGAVASVGTLSLVWKSLQDIHQTRRLGLYPFLTAACGLAVLAGEAMIALEILWVVSLGIFIEKLITEKSRAAVSDLLSTFPDTAYVLVADVEVETPVEEIRTGDTVVVHDGERVAVDGIVVGGRGLVDEAHITGRAEPELRESDDFVHAGTRVVRGTLFIRAEKVGEDTYLSHLLRLVDASLASGSELENKADELASRLVIIGGAATVGTYLLTHSLMRSLTVLLVMSCPCATVLATATALAAAIANAARRGILIKGGTFLERTEKIDILVFDKTGTITMDTPRVLEVVPRAPWQETNQVLALAANAEMESSHPMARALLAEARKEGVALSKLVESEVFLGRGVRARWDSNVVLVGNGPFLAEQGVDPSYFRAGAARFQHMGHSVIYVARNGRLQGMIVLGNRVQPQCPAVMARLRKDGIERLALISGDTLPVVQGLAESMGFDEFRAELLPEGKAEYIDRLQASGERVMMVGDGLNDAPALARATVGVAMGAGGSEVAIEAADIALMNNDLESLVHLRYLSRQSLRIVEQNFWIATLTNVIGIGFGGLGLITPVMAGMLHAVHTLGIMLNSSRLIAATSPEALDPTAVESPSHPIFTQS